MLALVTMMTMVLMLALVTMGDVDLGVFDKGQPADEFDDDHDDVLVVDDGRDADDGRGVDDDRDGRDAHDVHADRDGRDAHDAHDDREHLEGIRRSHQLQHQRQVQEILFVHRQRKMGM